MLKISVVVPSYNQGQFIEETFQSIFEQAYPDIEVIVIDGGSKDNTVDIIKKYEKQISYWVSEKDKGQSDAINKGFARATGDIVTWLCSDDLFLPGTLQSVNDHFNALPDTVGVIHGGVQMFEGDKDLEIDYGYENPCTERNISGMAFSQPAAFFRKIYLDRIGGKVSETLHYGMDYDLFSRLATVCQFHPVKDLYAKYRLHDASKSVSQQDKFIIDWCRVFVNFCKNAGWDDTLTKLSSVSPLQEAIPYFQPFNFEPDPGILSSIDKEKALFYHLCYQVRSLFASGKIAASRKMLARIKKEFPGAWLQSEKLIPFITTRLFWPDFVLIAIRKIRGK
ncbi:MAG: glycosyltransferase [Terrimonas sp.]|nr:glycosyltransferase [Terrimonas sp.]